MGKELVGDGWEATEPVNGVRAVTCNSWAGYVEFLNGTLLDYRSYIFRGHASEAWKLESTLDRALLTHGESKANASTRLKHLENFKYAARGRRGSAPHQLSDENDWWALGQHNGLTTPLLDWSESPYVAAYFAFCSANDKENSKNRVVFALSRISAETKSAALLREAKKSGGTANVMSFVRPMSDDNPRLITQRGLFTRSPDNVPVEDWVQQNVKGKTNGAMLIRITIPSGERELAMKSLNRMNINHLSLFPDIYGAAKYCNFELSINKY